jgi:hypothetical protein
MSWDSTDIADIKNLLTGFITEQQKFNSEQKQFNAEQREFNIKIDKKIDKVQYYLEESLAQSTKMFFEEQIELKAEVESLENEVSNLNETVAHIMSELKLLQLKLT